MDPDRGRLPGARFANRRILELNARRETTSEAIAALDGQRPGGSRPAEIEAMLDAVPDLRPAIRSTSEEELGSFRLFSD
jgi:hypothetical protein